MGSCPNPAHRQVGLYTITYWPIGGRVNFCIRDRLGFSGSAPQHVQVLVTKDGVREPMGQPQDISSTFDTRLTRARIYLNLVTREDCFFQELE